ncbi:DUF4112 domain-containing protein [Sphingomonas sp. Leaf339]|uniref:DUF4112 domain-containing protein n=1 Tax=Sphingomonas sp. Leaf339 TaxID=1736343 RepID=UPI000AAB0EE6|nr:DUF4112 domain-containing protein [Sphingomonas sp. Leaf339]
MTPNAALFDQLPIGRDPASVRRRVEALEKLLERSFTMPGVNRQFGLDFLIGLVPVVGDVLAAAMGTWLVWEARNLGMSKFQIARMMGNVGFDAVLGIVPFVGDAADFFFRSNTRNLRIIHRHLDKHHPGTVTIDR